MMVGLEPTPPFASFSHMEGFLSEPVERLNLGSHPIAAPTTTGRKMRERILESAANPFVRKWAEKIIQDVTPRDQRGEVDAIFRFVQSHVRFVRDPRGTEFVQSPVLLLRQISAGDTPGGDCDDKTTLTLSLLRAIGYPTVIRITGYPHNPPGHFSHVYGMVNVKGDWIAVDAVRTDRSLGWEAPAKVRRVDIPV